MATSALQFSHVTLGYENIITTSDLNLTIPQGDYLCIIGENGSGKSTFVKNLLGLLKPLSGEIALTGDWKRSDIGYLPQQTPAQRDFPASVREIVRSGFLNQMKHRLPQKKTLPNRQWKNSESCRCKTAAIGNSPAVSNSVSYWHGHSVRLKSC